MPEPEDTAAGHLIWRMHNSAAACDLSGHFWAVAWPAERDGRIIWSWMIIGYEGQVLASGQTGNLSVAKRLVEEWDRWVAGSDAELDEWDNPVPVADDGVFVNYRPVWPEWPWQQPQGPGR